MFNGVVFIGLRISGLLNSINLQGTRTFFMIILIINGKFKETFINEKEDYKLKLQEIVTSVLTTTTDNSPTVKRVMILANFSI